MTPRGVRPLVVVGGGEHARVVVDAARSQPEGWEVLGFVDPALREDTCAAGGVARLGDDAALAALRPAPTVVLGVGSLQVSRHRAEVVSRHPGAQWGVVVHASAVVSPSSQLGEGTVVLAGAVINAGARVGRHVVVGTGAIVEHDVELGDFVLLGPGAILGGGAVVGDGSFVGLGARVRDHTRVGREVTVGMGAVVVSPVGDGLTVVGVPARPWSARG